MTIHTLYIFSKRGACLYYTEWARARPPVGDDVGEEAKLMFGLVFSLKQLMVKMNPDGPAPPPGTARPGGGGADGDAAAAAGGFHRFVASGYALHYFESPTGYRFVLTTDPAAGDMRAVMLSLYDLYVAFALRNPAYTPGTTVTVTGFVSEVDRFVRSLPSFR